MDEHNNEHNNEHNSSTPQWTHPQAHPQTWRGIGGQDHDSTMQDNTARLPALPRCKRPRTAPGATAMETLETLEGAGNFSDTSPYGSRTRKHHRSSSLSLLTADGDADSANGMDLAEIDGPTSFCIKRPRVHSDSDSISTAHEASHIPLCFDQRISPESMQLVPAETAMRWRQEQQHLKDLDLQPIDAIPFVPSPIAVLPIHLEYAAGSGQMVLWRPQSSQQHECAPSNEGFQQYHPLDLTDHSPRIQELEDSRDHSSDRPETPTVHDSRFALLADASATNEDVDMEL
eukprot:jgi/Hompol1/2235/HPOL_002157-RA